MIKRICSVFLILVLILSLSLNVLACDEEQTNSYVLQILFGNDASRYEANKEVNSLLSALYICSEQSNRDGQDKLNFLKKAKVGKIPSLEKINISSNQLLECSHNSWDHEIENIEKIQKARKDILRRTVIKEFDFGWINETFKRNSGKIDSFAALLYYLHILADYLADDPTDTAISAKGYDIPAYSGEDSVILHGNTPEFTAEQKTETESYKKFSNFDAYDRTGVVMANIGPDTLAPTNSRQQIGNIKPSGWHQEKYDGLVNSNPPYLFNRCHLIAHQLINVDEKTNLITGTRYLNESMVKYENKVWNYVVNTGNHVLYRVTPVYIGDNLVASGIQVEGYSVEDEGEGVCFNVYLYNVQPGVDINYANGCNERADKIYGTSNTLPFASLDPTAEKPDLMYEIGEKLKVLFADQGNDLNNMMRDLNEIADKARGKSGSDGGRAYLEMKQCQYEYAEKLSEYVPGFLAKEKFFKTAFN